MPDNEPKPKKPPMSGKQRRRKGLQYEQEIARSLQELWPDAKRGIGQVRAAGEAPDVTGTPYWIECKHKKTVSIRAAYEQGLQASITRSGPTTFTQPVLVISRENRTEDLVTMSLAEFKQLHQRLHDAQDSGYVRSSDGVGVLSNGEGAPPGGPRRPGDDW